MAKARKVPSIVRSDAEAEAIEKFKKRLTALTEKRGWKRIISNGKLIFLIALLFILVAVLVPWDSLGGVFMLVGILCIVAAQATNYYK